MNPLLMMLLAGGGAGLSALGTFINNRQPAKDLTADWVAENGSRDLNAARSNNWWEQLTGAGNLNPNGWYNNAQGAGNQASSFLNMLSQGMGPGGQFNSQNQLNELLGLNPNLLGLATSAAEQGTSMYGQSMNDLARLQSRNAMRDMENRLSSGGLLGASTGAATKAIGQAAQEPLMKALTDIGAMYNQSFQNTYNPMSQAAYGNILNRPTQYMNAIGAASGLMGQYGNIGQGLAGFLNDQSQQYLVAPTFQQQEDPFATFLSTLGGGMAGMGFDMFAGMDTSRTPSAPLDYTTTGGHFVP